MLSFFGTSFLGSQNTNSKTFVIKLKVLPHFMPSSNIWMVARTQPPPRPRADRADQRRFQKRSSSGSEVKVEVEVEVAAVLVNVRYLK